MHGYPRDACKMRGRSTGSGVANRYTGVYWASTGCLFMPSSSVVPDRMFRFRSTTAWLKGLKGGGGGQAGDSISTMDEKWSVGDGSAYRRYPRLPLHCNLTIQYNRGTWSTFGGENWVKSNMGKDE